MTDPQKKKISPYKPEPQHASLYKRLDKAFGMASGDYGLLKEGDRILVAMSGGKDSYTLFHLLKSFQQRVPFKYDVFPVTVNTGFGEFRANVEKIKEHLKTVYDSDLHIIEEDFPSIIDNHLTPGTRTCSFCARLRRGSLSTYCKSQNINKIALGHHADDVIESMLMSQLQNGRLWTQAPIYENTSNISIIRPLMNIYEAQIVEFAKIRQFPIIKCNCPSEGDPSHFRAVAKRLVQTLTEQVPSARQNLLATSKQVIKTMRIDNTKDDEL
ncbi:tRNA 2-thiocytidine biosynthesis protein [Spironucleus salmonicida]|uniref:PP-loop superfamily protein n=1 Tax=Spironucleus salmonicida TaxID=348837 RepID=V6LCA2_9EUKA|nr:tRNA 2-thiocytidine biosynthesis protein [Spironucleus salmonicida]|eukprot:EST41863.1 PP-loop superfamily protein [Spironucleus salmonicida]